MTSFVFVSVQLLCNYVLLYYYKGILFEDKKQEQNKQEQNKNQSDRAFMEEAYSEGDIPVSFLNCLEK